MAARADSPPTLSKSCSDKLAMRQCTSLLCSSTSLLISPENAYLHTLVLPRSQHVHEACQRAFSDQGRLKALAGRTWNGGYAFKPFTINSTDHEFSFSRRSVASSGRAPPKGSNLSVAWNPMLEESLINGVLQGRKQTDPRGACGVSRLKMWKMVVDSLRLLAIPAIAHTFSTTRYMQMKNLDLLEDRRTVKRNVKEALNGWVSNVDDDFELDPI